MRLVLLHGFTQSGASWGPVREALRTRGVRDEDVLTPDLPGHGGAAGVEPITSFPGAAAAVGDECGRATYVGYSMGGRLALQLALDRPQLVEGLILVSTTGGIEDHDARTERLRADEALADRIEAGGDEGIPGFIDEWLSGPLFAGLRGASAGRSARLVNKAGGLAGALRLLGTGAQPSNWQRVAEISVPVLVVSGEHDHKFSEIGARLARAIGENARHVVVGAASHAVPFEAPDALAGLVVDFTKARRGRTAGPG